MTTNIYDLHDAAFKHVSAYVVLKDNERVATIAFKYPKNGAGRLWCYLHVIGIEMARGYAGGYGYDKKTAAFYNAAQKQTQVKLAEWESSKREAEYSIAKALLASGEGKDGHDWTRNLREAGFTVLKAI